MFFQKYKTDPHNMVLLNAFVLQFADQNRKRCGNNCFISKHMFKSCLTLTNCSLQFFFLKSTSGAKVQCSLEKKEKTEQILPEKKEKIE